MATRRDDEKPLCDPQRIDADWFASSFDSLYPVLYAHRTVEAAAPESKFAAGILGIDPDTRLLDLGCGNGRHLVHLTHYTPNATGLDYSGALLSKARALLDDRTTLVRGDMRTLPFAGAFDVVTSFFTSFGYFSSEENAVTARGMAGALRLGGRLFLDYLNAGWVEDSLVPRSERQVNNVRIVEERWIDQRARRVNKCTHVYRDDAAVASYGESVELYTREGLRSLLEDAGLRVDALYGDYHGAEQSATSPRMIAVATRMA